MGLTHFDGQGRARMVDVGGKPVTRRIAVAKGWIRMSEEAFDLVRSGGVAKGDVLGVARIAAIMAAKRVDHLVPLCHSLGLDAISVDFAFAEDAPVIEITATAAISAKTGVEMEALTAVSVAALTIYDMCKAVDKAMEIGGIRLVRKSGGKSGDFVNPGAAAAR